MKKHHKLILGTVQLGLPYGIANTTGQPDIANAKAIVAAAMRCGIAAFDTAHAYGTSEEVLGESLKDIHTPTRVISKLPAELRGTKGEGTRCLELSLKALQRESLFALLFHREEHLPLLDGPLGEDISSLLQEGLIEKFGISVYTEAQALLALQHPLISIVQLPASLLDRRFEQAGVFAEAKRSGKCIHIRSALLQGVLTMPADRLPNHLGGLVPAVQRFHEICDLAHVPPASLALGWLLRRFPECEVLFGAERPEQIRENMSSLDHVATLEESIFEALDTVIPPQEAALLNPSLWTPES